MRIYNNYCGNENITFIYYNEWADPEIEYMGFRWHTPDIEGFLYDRMLEDNLPDTQSQLTAYINRNIEAYLIEQLYNMECFNIDYVRENAPAWFESLRDNWYDSDDDIMEKYRDKTFTVSDFVTLP